MASTIRCDIVSAEAEIFHGEVELVVATGELGELGIAPKHAPLITRLKPGKVVVTVPGGEKLDFAISGGILFGIAGALLAIPTVASLLLIYREVLVPALDRAGGVRHLRTGGPRRRRARAVRRSRRSRS